MSQLSVLNEKFERLIKSPGGILITALFLFIGATFAFASRMPLALQQPNFYAEDGNKFIQDAINNGTLPTLFTEFNGYLILGQYMLIEIAMAVYELLQLPFYDLPVVMAWVSFGFLGLTATLPFILLRRQIGVPVAILAAIATCLVALPSSDYAVIGTIGNLKFLFLLWAFYFIMYRNFNYTDIRKTTFADVMIALSILTYAPAAALLPFAVWPYRVMLLSSLKSRNMKKIPRTFVSLAVLCLLCGVYLLVVYLNGIPKLPGYLDAPYVREATIKILYRVTFYDILVPLTSSMRDIVTLGLVGVATYLGVAKRETRFVTIFGLWAVGIATVAFVINRPGVSYAFTDYGPNPDQFFYSQAILFTFVIICIGVAYAKHFSLSGKALLWILVALLIWWRLPAIGSDQINKTTYAELGTAESNLKKLCGGKDSREVDLQIYPTTLWKWKLNREIACEGL